MTCFSPGLGRDAGRAPSEPSSSAVPRRLTAAQRQVVHLSRRDAASSLLSRHAPARHLRRLLGIAPSNPLADPLLEALRRYVILLRHGGDILAAESHGALLDLGMSEEQVRHARWLVSREPMPERRPLSRTIIGLALSLAVVAGVLAHEAIEEPALALVAGLLVLVTIAPLAVSAERPAARSYRP